MARIIDIEADSNGDVRSAILKVADKGNGKCNILRRPISKVVLLVESEVDSPTKRAREPLKNDQDVSHLEGSQMKWQEQ